MIVKQILLGALSHTTEDTYKKLVFLTSLVVHGMEEFQTIDDFLFGIAADGTCVHEHSIGLIQRVANTVTSHLHNRGNYFTIGHVHLAAIRLDKEFLVVGR